MKMGIKNGAVIIGAMMLAIGFSACDKKSDLSTDKAKYSYAIGHQIGRNMKMQGIELDEVAFSQAVRDQLAGKESALKEEDMRNALQKMSEMQQKESQEKAKANLEQGKKFLEENKAKDGVKVTESGLQYKVMEEGSGPSPKESDVVSVHYKGTLLDGTEFDSSYKRNTPAEFPVRAVIKGWTEALQLMKKGAKYTLYIPPELAYGERGNPTIPGNSVLVFEVELLDIKDQKGK